MKDIAVLVIAFSLVAFVVIYGITIIASDFFKVRFAKNIKIRQNGVDIILTKEEYRKYMEDKRRKIELEKAIEKEKIIREQKAFTDRKIVLNNKIKDLRKSCNDTIICKVLDELLKIEPETDYELTEKEWLFNNGKLRTNEEIQKHESEIDNAKHKETFDGDRALITVGCSVSFFFITFVLVFISCEDFKKLPIIGLPIALFAALFAGLIGSAIGHTINLSNAEKYGIPDNHPSVRKEKLARGLDIAGIAISSASAINSTKKAAKDVMNVDGWKEFK